MRTIVHAHTYIHAHVLTGLTGEISEREQKECDAELLNLQIQLKAIEVQCLSYVPQDADQELRDSIDAWKMEWSALKQRRARNKDRLGDTPTRRRAGPAAAE